MKTLVIVAITLLTGASVAHLLGSNRFCYSNLHFTTDDEFARIAAGSEVYHYGALTPAKARSVEEFMKEFPNCCGASIDKETLSLSSSIFGLVQTYAYVRYTRVESGIPREYEVVTRFDSCGESLDSWKQSSGG